MKRLMFPLLLLGLMTVSANFLPAFAMETLSDRTINKAVEYGMKNQEEGISSFMGSNWREGADGALLNIYTPYMEIARSATHRKLTTNPGPEDIANARNKMVEDIHYIWTHPTVKFMVSLYGDNSSFAKEYYAVIEGVGKGRSFTIYPTKIVPQTLADKEKDVTIKPFSAVNAYQFKFEDVAPLDEFVFKLYGKNLEPIKFRIVNQDIR